MRNGERQSETGREMKAERAETQRSHIFIKHRVGDREKAQRETRRQRQ